jgi:protein tyrosine phosphatase
MCFLNEQYNLRTDYVNACYIPGYYSPTEYIASQGPVPDGFPAYAHPCV